MPLASSEEDDSVTEDANEKVCIDEHAALAALDGQRELLCELATIFCEDCPVLLQELQAAVDAGDTDNARLLTHSLKGLAATFYAQPTLEWAARLEQEAAEGRLQAFVNGGLKRLSNSVMSLIDLLKDRYLKT